MWYSKRVVVVIFLVSNANYWLDEQCAPCVCVWERERNLWPWMTEHRTQNVRGVQALLFYWFRFVHEIRFCQTDWRHRSHDSLSVLCALCSSLFRRIWTMRWCMRSQWAFSVNDELRRFTHDYKQQSTFSHSHYYLYICLSAMCFFFSSISFSLFFWMCFDCNCRLFILNEL